MRIQMTFYLEPNDYWNLKAIAEAKSLTVTEYLLDLIRQTLEKDRPRKAES